MLTNLLQSITFSLLVTNTSVNYPKQRISIPCPDGVLGCPVYHSKMVDVLHPTNRSIFTEILLKEVTEIPSLKLKATNTTLLVSWEVKEELKSYWIPVQPQPMPSSLRLTNMWSMMVSNISITNISFLSKTNK